MPRFLSKLLVAASMLALATTAWPFSLRGPAAAWMTPRLGYDLNNDPLFGPMQLAEEYRWNVPVVYYACTPEFKQYFGPEGLEAIDEVFKVLNAIPAASRINLDSYPLTSQRVNHRAAALGLSDVKSSVLGRMLENMGMADPTRFVFTLRNRYTTTDPPTTNYYIIRRNYDPRTWLPSSYINDVLYTYAGILDDDVNSLAITRPVDPLEIAGALRAPVVAWTRFVPGGFYTGLTRDDMGALYYIYRPDNINIEGLAPSIAGVQGGGAWGPPSNTGTNATTTSNTVTTTSLRPGRDRITFKKLEFDSVLGFFEPITNGFTDTYITNSYKASQYLERAVLAPDILFHVADLQGADGDDLIPAWELGSSTWTAGNSTTNGGGGTTTTGLNLGPGVIDPAQGAAAFTFTFNGVGEILWNTFPFDSLNELTASRFLLWASFDGSTNEPVIYPIGLSVMELEERVLSGDSGDPWNAPPGGVTTGGGDAGGGTGGGTGTGTGQGP